SCGRRQRSWSTNPPASGVTSNKAAGGLAAWNCRDSPLRVDYRFPEFRFSREAPMSEPLIDLKALLVEHEDCDAGTVQKLRTGLAQGGTQFRALREVTETLTKRLEAGQGNPKKVHLKLGIAYYFLGYMEKAAENLRHAETALGAFYLGRALVARQQYDEALKAFDKSEKLGYTGSTVRLQKAGIHLRQGEPSHARDILNQSKKDGLESHSAEYHFQVAGLHHTEGDRPTAVKHLERAVELDPAHTGALFQLGYVNDLAG